MVSEKMSAKAMPGSLPLGKAPTLQEIRGDVLTQMAAANWAVGGPRPAFNPALVKNIYRNKLTSRRGRPVPLQRVMMLEISQFLENYLWPNFNAVNSTYEHVMAIILMVNEKFRENVPAWRAFHRREDVFPAFFQRVLSLPLEGTDMTLQEKVSYLLFMINCFQSLEDEMVRPQMLQLVSLSLWHAVSPGRRQIELRSHPEVEKKWKKLLKREAREVKNKTLAANPLERPAVMFLPSLLDNFLTLLSTVAEAPVADGNGQSVKSMDVDAPAEAEPPVQKEGDEAKEGDVAEEKDQDEEEGKEEEEEEEGEEEEVVEIGGNIDPTALLYCERFMEFLIDLLSQLPTRRFVRLLVEDRMVVVKCSMSRLFRHPSGRLFRQLVDLLRYYVGFEINDYTGMPFSEEEMASLHYERLQALQRLVFREMPELRELALCHIGAIEKRSELSQRLAALTPTQIEDLVVHKLMLVSEDDPWAQRTDFLVQVMLSAFERRMSQQESVNELPLYPNENIMWDESQVPSLNYSGQNCLALPKLNLQFLTLHDYLLRNFTLFRLESTYEIREDVQDVLKRMRPTLSDDGETTRFAGWARMALPIQNFMIQEVKQPNIGEVKPAAVTAHVTFSTGSLSRPIRSEWDELKEHDVLFLLTVRAPPKPQEPEDGADTNGAETDGKKTETQKKNKEKRKSVPEQYGLLYVRGCEVVEMQDEEGNLMNDFSGRVKREDWAPPKGEVRTAVVALDTAQYQLDMSRLAEQKDAAAGTMGEDEAPLEDVYGSFNIVMRRKPQENNFKAVLECIRDLMNEQCVMPDWLHDIFLGYGDPGAAQYFNMPDQLKTIDFKDTFLTAEHLKESFPGKRVEFVTPDGGPDPNPKPPFRVTSHRKPSSTATEEEEEAPEKRRKNNAKEPVADGAKLVADVVVEAYEPPHPGPYPEDKPNQNSVRFTPVQVEAIVAGVQPGLTMVVGPPGTGKTDTAVQTLHVLYHNCPSQRTLLITHSNQALNDIFAKIMQRDVPARYLLRLGMGEADLETELDFSRQGRVNAMLARRLELLAEVERLARTLNISTDLAYTCETAAHFWLLHVLSRWEAYVAACQESSDDPAVVKNKFPFTEFFANAPGPLFTGASYARDMHVATGCFRHLHTMFQELEECRAFELLKTTADRSNYLMTKQAKIVAMTCTHAALKRHDFVQLGFHFDNLLMEESAQILEIETFIPMLLQRPTDGRARLKRCVLIGDHHQLPPVVKNLAFQKYSHLDQSLFTRFVRLGTPYLELNAQGRARSSIASLYNWRYRALGDLPAVQEGEYRLANPGFTHEFQLIDVPDHQGRGESEPLPWFYQNLGEAEYVVSVYQYMRLLGYPANKISILTTYNGQKNLIHDVIERRCADHPLFGRPSKITTVDKFQGQQNDYILLSLVRTRAVGHLRDVRRLVVAMSRARLGLYIFARRTLFEQCYELQPAFTTLLKRPDRLALVLHEHSHPTSRRVEDPVQSHIVSGLEEMAVIVARKWELWVQAQGMDLMRRQAAAMNALPR